MGVAEMPTAAASSVAFARSQARPDWIEEPGDANNKTLPSMQGLGSRI